MKKYKIKSNYNIIRVENYIFYLKFFKIFFIEKIVLFKINSTI